MKTLSIQFDETVGDLSVREAFVEKVKQLIHGCEVVENTDGVNVYITTADAAHTWSVIESKVLCFPVFSKSCTVIVEGDRGWDDLIFLHSNE